MKKRLLRNNMDTEKLIDKKDIVTLARKRMTMAIAAYSESRESELDDLRFYAGSPDNQWQWPADVLSTRGSVQGQTINARPCLTMNKLPQHVRQVTNDQRQNRPSGKVIPVSDDADKEVADVFEGIIRYIEYNSDADVAYDTACENQVTYGEGYIRLATDYCSADTFDQDIKIKRIRSSFSVYMDPTAQDPCGADAEWCLITEDLTKEEYEQQFPDAMPISSLQPEGVGDQSLSQWITEDTVRIAEYFYKEHTAAKLNLYKGGMTLLSTDPKVKSFSTVGIEPIKTRDVDIVKVKWCKINGFEILEERDWAGSWIPVVRIVGNEFEVDGRLYVSGLVRNAKDAQRMYNYWTSQEAEMLALAPKAPFIGYGGQFEGYENQWKTANTTNWPYLEVNADVQDGQGRVLPLPQRAQPPMAQAGLIQAKMGASDDIKSTTGQYDTSLGATSNERSGRAIFAREKQSDTGTYHYGDNLARGVRYLCRQIVEIAPKIYDTPRVLQILGLDGESKPVEIDPDQKEAVKTIVDEQGNVVKKIYNPNVGKYDVRVGTGPSYMTKRQEAMEAMGKILEGNPQLWAVAGDLFVKNMDWPGSAELSERLAKTIDPKLLADDKEDPQLAAAQQQIQGMGQELDKLHQMLQNVSKSMEAQELQNKHFEADIKAYDAETKRLSVLAGAGTPEEIKAIVMKTVQEILTSPSLEQEEPAAAEMGETAAQPTQATGSQLGA